MKFAYLTLCIIAFAVSNQAYANLLISNYCSQSSDCSPKFKQLVQQAQLSRDTIDINQNTILSNVDLKGLNLSYLSLTSSNNSQINAGTLDFRGVDYVSISDITIDGIDYTQNGFLVALDGALDGVNIKDNVFKNSEGDLLNIGNSRMVTVQNNQFKYSGTTKETYPSGVTKGNGLIVWDSTSGIISSNNFYDIWQVGIFLKEHTTDFTVDSNIINTVQDNGIRIQSDADWYEVADITVNNNTLTNVNIDAIRVNGTRMTITNNIIDGQGRMTVGVKAEGLVNSKIFGNYIKDGASGINLFARYGRLDDITIRDNKVEHTNRAIAVNAEANTGYSMDNLIIHHNEFYNTLSSFGAPAWVVEIFGNASQSNSGISLHSNTITNRQLGDQFEHYVIRLKNLHNPYIGNNYIDGTTPYSFIQAVDLNLADFNGNTFIRRHSGSSSWGAVRVDSSDSMLIRNNRFESVCPSIVSVNGSTYTDQNNIETPKCN
jgi:hypothetical protein